MTVAEQHSAGASLSGFGLQLDRAIEWLAQANLGDQVGIESLDDVVMQSQDGRLRIEQDKLSFVRNPIADRSLNLWKTLGIWISLLESGECELSNCQFYLVTNRPISQGIASALREPPQLRQRRAIADQVRKLAASPSKEWTTQATQVLALKRDALAELLDRITVVDNAPFGDLETANNHLGNKLLLSSEIVAPVLRALRGWILEISIEHFSKQARKQADSEPAWVTVGNFRDQLHRLITSHYDDRLIVRAAKEISVTTEQTEQAKLERFVRQLELISFDSDNPEDFIDAIADFWRSKDERTRLAVENGITSTIFGRYEDELAEQWKIERRSVNRQRLPSEVETGQELLDRCLSYHPHLDGQVVSESYLSRGTYHALANDPTSVVGWHPRFQELLRSGQ